MYVLEQTYEIGADNRGKASDMEESFPWFPSGCGFEWKSFNGWRIYPGRYEGSRGPMGHVAHCRYWGAKVSL